MVSHKYVLKFLYLFTFILLSSQSFSETITFKGLVLSDFWIKKVIANNNITVGYIKIENKNEKNERLISVVSDFSKRIEIHDMYIKNNVMYILNVIVARIAPRACAFVVLSVLRRHLLVGCRFFRLAF